MILDVAPRLRDTLTRGFLILDWMKAELIAQKCGGPYYAPNPLRGGASKGCRPTVFLTRFADELPHSSRKCGTSEDMSKGARGGKPRRPRV